MTVKSIGKKLRRYLTDPDYRFLVGAELGWYNHLSDEEYLRRYYRAAMGKELNLEQPETFNEKLQWMKLHNRRPEYVQMVDKYLARDYIAEKIGAEYLIPLLGVWEDPEQIDFAALPDQFVLKCNHNSGMGLCICRDKKTLDIPRVKKELKKGLREDYYLKKREWPYRDVPRRIICEKYMTDSDQVETFTDYKFFCFNGEVDCVMLCLDRNTGHTKFYFFDKDWQLLRLNIRGKEAPADFTLPKPEKMDEMFALAAKLSEGMPFARIDLYNSKGQIYFGEITLFPDSGFDRNLLPETDVYFGSKLQLGEPIDEVKAEKSEKGK